MILILMTKILIMIGMIIMVIVMIVTNILQDHIMFTMGDDFQYQNAVMNYKNMDKVFFLINVSSSLKEQWIFVKCFQMFRFCTTS